MRIVDEGEISGHIAFVGLPRYAGQGKKSFGARSKREDIFCFKIKERLFGKGRTSKQQSAIMPIP